MVSYQPGSVYNVEVGNSFFDKTQQYYYLRYDFLPASVDNEKPGTLTVDESNKATVLRVAGEDEVAFTGSFAECKSEECVLLIEPGPDGECHFRLERLCANVKNLKHVRALDKPRPPKPRAEQEKHVVDPPELKQTQAAPEPSRKRSKVVPSFLRSSTAPPTPAPSTPSVNGHNTPSLPPTPPTPSLPPTPSPTTFLPPTPSPPVHTPATLPLHRAVSDEGSTSGESDSSSDSEGSESEEGLSWTHPTGLAAIAPATTQAPAAPLTLSGTAVPPIIHSDEED